MNKIQIYDDFFSEKIVNKIKETINGNNWKCICMERPDNDRYLPYAYWNINLLEDKFFSSELRKKIESNFKKNIKLELDRLIVLSQLYGQDCTYHTDHESKSLLDYENGQCFDNKDITFCYYLNDNDSEITGGNLYFKIPEEKYIMCVEPKNNRGIYFPAYMLHKTTCFNKTNINRRICITFKFVY